MFEMLNIELIVLWVFAILMAGAIGWYFWGVDLVFSKYVKGYDRAKKGKGMVYTALTFLFLLEVVWFLVSMVLVMLNIVKS
jgi:hypothetical protein